MLKLVTFTFCIVNAYRNLLVLAYGNLFSKTIVLYPVIKKLLYCCTSHWISVYLYYSNGVALAYGHI
jgi:hypothetical protein